MLERRAVQAGVENLDAAILTEYIREAVDDQWLEATDHDREAVAFKACPLIFASCAGPRAG